MKQGQAGPDSPLKTGSDERPPIAPQPTPLTAREVRERLTSLHDPADAKIVAGDIGLRLAKINFAQQAERVWDQVVDEARKRGLIEKLIERSAQDYPTSWAGCVYAPSTVDRVTSPGSSVRAIVAVVAAVLGVAGLALFIRHITQPKPSPPPTVDVPPVTPDLPRDATEEDSHLHDASVDEAAADVLHDVARDLPRDLPRDRPHARPPCWRSACDSSVVRDVPPTAPPMNCGRGWRMEAPCASR